MDEIEVRLLGSGEAGVLARVAEDVFDHAVSPEWTAAFLDDPRHHLAVALDDGTVVGFASGVDHGHPDKPLQLWINEVSVAPSHRERGVGTRLVRSLLAHGRTLGCVEAWVLTEGDNAAARRLYAAAGGKESPELVVMVEFDLGSDA